MERLALQEGLVFNQDVRLISEGEADDFIGYIKTNWNKTQIAVVFCTEQWPIMQSGVNIPCKFEDLHGQKLYLYSVFYNFSLHFQSPYFVPKIAYPKDPLAVSLKLSMDNALAHYLEYTNTNSTVPYDPSTNLHHRHISLHLQDFPKTEPRFFQGYDIITGWGAFYFFVPYMVLFITTSMDMLREKEKRLRHGMTVMGLTHMSFWMSWFITAVIMVTIISAETIACGVLFNFKTFTHSPYLYGFLVLIFGLTCSFYHV